MPPMKATGANTATVVVAPPSTEKATSSVPTWLAPRAGMPSSMCRWMFSSTTVVASTTIPTAREIPIMVRLFTESPRPFMNRKLPRRHTGMVITATKVARRVRRKNSMMREHRATACITLEATPVMERRTKSAWLERTFSSTPLGASLRSSSSISRVPSATATSLAPRCLRTVRKSTP